MSSQDETLGAEDSQSRAPDVATPVPGERIGRYLVLGKLGEGGMGVVYAAYDPELDRKVAVKLLHAPKHHQPPSMDRARGNVMAGLFGDTPPSASARERAPEQQRLLREAQAAARVNDPSVVTVHDVGEHGGRVFVAMEFVRGRTLKAWSCEQTRGWREVVDVWCRAGQGLVAAHECGLVHRDFKPDNVMLGDDGRVRVMDFGLVRAAFDDPSHEDEQAQQPTTDAFALELTAGGAAMGTPAYMSPEQYGGKIVDARSDQFSFCVALWEGLYGVRPFVGTSIASLAVAVVQGDRRPPPADRNVPSAIHEILVRGLATDPAQRWPSMRRLLDELRRDPLQRRNRIVLAIAVLAVGGGAYGVVAARRASAVAGCREAGESIGEVWNDGARAAIRAHAEATGASYAGASSDTIMRALDEHATRWTSVQQAVCTATIDGSAMPTDAQTCLDERRAELEGTIAALSTVDATSIRGAVAVATSLDGPEACSDPAAAALRAVQRSDAPPEVLASARARIREARQLALLRRFDEATTVLTGLRSAGAPLPPVIDAWVQLASGEIAEKRGDYDVAQALLVEAAWAAEAAGDQPTVAQASSALVWVIGYRRGRPAEAEHWIRWSRVLFDRLALSGSLSEAGLLERLGMVDSSRQAYDTALASIERSVEIRRAQLGADHPEVALALNSLGNVQMNRGGPAAAAPLWEEALAILEAALGKTHPDLSGVLGNLAQVRFRLGDLGAARRLMERSIAIGRAEFGPNHPTVARALTNLGTVLQAKGDLDDARTVLNEAKVALERTHGREHRSLGTLALQRGKVEAAAGNVDEAIAILEAGLALLERLVEPNDLDIAVGVSSLALAYERKGDLDRAVALSERSLAICLAHGPDGHPVFTSQALYQLGRLEGLRGQHDHAIELLERAVTRLELAAGSDSIDTADARFALAQSLWQRDATRDRARALAAASRALYAQHADEKRLAVVDAWLAKQGPPK